MTMKIPSNLTMVLLILTISCPVSSQGMGGGPVTKNKQTLWFSGNNHSFDTNNNMEAIQPVAYIPPVWGNALRQKGFDLPLPFGMGVNFIALNQTNEISNLVVSAQGIEIPFDVQFRNTRSTDINLTFRLDMCILPFINVYGIAGYTSGRVSPDILVPATTMDVPIIGQIEISSPITFRETLQYFGSTFGYGLTLAGGFKSIFISVDYNQTWTHLNIAPDALRTMTMAPRIGLLLDASMSRGHGALWMGAMVINYHQTFLGSVPVEDIDPELISILGNDLDYSLDLGNSTPWNFILGGSWIISKRMNLMLEAGVGDRFQILTGFDVRL